MKKSYDIYMEGYRATGEAAGASYIGTAIGYDFKDACRTFMEAYDPSGRYYDEVDNDYWGCKLFDNMDDASKRFG